MRRVQVLSHDSADANAGSAEHATGAGDGDWHTSIRQDRCRSDVAAGAIGVLWGRWNAIARAQHDHRSRCFHFVGDQPGTHGLLQDHAFAEQLRDFETLPDRVDVRGTAAAATAAAATAERILPATAERDPQLSLSAQDG